MTEHLRNTKTCWHPLALQQLTPNRLTGVVNGILAGRLTLVSYVLKRPPDIVTGPGQRPPLHDTP